MKLSFHGAARQVTGSCHLVSVAGKRILIDCGMFQGAHELHDENAADFGFDPAKIDMLLLTHAHLDHCGRIPLLVKRGFSGPIIATGATRDLARLVMMDSAHLHEEEARRYRRHGQRIDALYDRLDALDAVALFGRAAQYGKPLDLFPGITVTFLEAGHILGSASILLELSEGERHRRLLFSGDIGPGGRPLLNDPAPPTGVDAVVMETTYGDRDHRSLDESIDEFYEAIRDARTRGGNVVIPTFALERAQELLWYLRAGFEEGRIEPGLSLYLDSPMAISATRIFGRHPEAMGPAPARMVHSGRDPFWLPGLEFTQEARDSMALNTVRSGALIMAGSGMCTGGRVRHHLRHNLGNAGASIIFVGFAAEGTLARIIIDGAKAVKLFGDEVPVRARIHTINGFSAHAGRAQLKAWHAKLGSPHQTFLVHGEAKTMESLAGDLQGLVHRPRMASEYEI
ncbi:MBL fold metallo-hydrolase RNA specificity domain-containing protein [Salipiger mangrovisoli]|uniref:MBL fold metallo-hydrolase n=1 Tax=Salipiger mangrovisoli TaxID=2865933 RepID=A0ABR9X5R9_9RHOB|nr:MBL fold metallo-hydrolase [Salipiger mangrovisoli]MBE9638808.1 MBL fold metallo-hydrolase [Salipiger mangrovisoli]